MSIDHRTSRTLVSWLSPTPRLFALVPVLFAALASFLVGSAQAVPCSACHLETATHFDLSGHGAAFQSAPDSSVQGDAQCVLCHGSGTEHVGNPLTGTIVTFGLGSAGDAKAQNTVCASCHKNQQHPEANAHTLAGVACASCHSVHVDRVTDHERRAGLRPTEPLSADSVATRESQLQGAARDNKKLVHDPLPGVTQCVGCHQDTAAQFSFNERHRLAPGGVACTSCHDPHNPTVATGLGGFSGGLEQGCGECHSNLSGPFVFEHGASRVEGCRACHSPHGSPNRHMLVFQEVGQLCYSCHAEVPQFHTGFAPGAPARFDLQTQCTSCHVAVHGSNHDRALLR